MAKEATILIVDDAPKMRARLKKILKENAPGCKFFEAEDGIEAVKKYKQFKPNLVTMGVDLPKSNGIIALAAIREIDPQAKVIMVSSQKQKNLAEDVIKLGAIDYITKPFDRTIVAPKLVKALRDTQ